MKPSTYKSILILFLLNSLLSVKAQDFRFGKVSKEELEEKVHPLDSTANAAILYREVDARIEYSDNEGFYLVNDVFERIKIYNKEGYDWGTKSVNLFKSSGSNKEELNGLRGYTYTLVNGKIEDNKLRSEGVFEEETTIYLNRTKFTLPNIQDGCVIEFKYSIKSPFIQDVSDFRLQESIPINKLNVTFNSPEYFNYKPHQKGWYPIHLKTDTKNGKINFGSFSRRLQGAVSRSTYNNSQVEYIENIYFVESENIPAVKEEKYAGNINNYASSIKFELAYTKFPNSNLETYSTTWDAVTRSIYQSESFGGQLDRSNYFDDDIDGLLSGVSNPNEKMIRIFEFVKNKMNWNSFVGCYTNEGVRTAYKNGTGNSAEINLMLVAMLRYAGLKASPVLISTKSNGIPLFPTRNGFNFVIAAVESNKGIALMDATNKIGEPNILENELLNWQGRIIREDMSSTWIPLSPDSPAVRDCMISAVINDDLSILGNTQNRFTGHYALGQRKKYINVGLDEVRKQIEKNLSEVEISEVNHENLETLYKPVNLVYDFETFDVIEEISGKLYFSPLLFMAADENPFKAEDRKYPIDFEYPIKDRYLVKYQIPEGYMVESVPKNSSFALPDNLGSFRYMINNSEKEIQISTELAINTSLFAPEMYQNLKKFFELVVQKENEKVVLTKI